MIVVDSAAVVDALTTAAGSDDLRAEIVGADLACDAAYVALAEALQCPVLTRDARLARSSGHDVEIRVR